jgi:hypothetical protein
MYAEYNTHMEVLSFLARPYASILFFHSCFCRLCTLLDHKLYSGVIQYFYYGGMLLTIS